jgi:hypothetical protein
MACTSVAQAPSASSNVSVTIVEQSTIRSTIFIAYSLYGPPTQNECVSASHSGCEKDTISVEVQERIPRQRARTSGSRELKGRKSLKALTVGRASGWHCDAMMMNGEVSKAASHPVFRMNLLLGSAAGLCNFIDRGNSAHTSYTANHARANQPTAQVR